MKMKRSSFLLGLAGFLLIPLGKLGAVYKTKFRLKIPCKPVPEKLGEGEDLAG